MYSIICTGSRSSRPPDILEMDWDRRATSRSFRDRARLLLDGARRPVQFENDVHSAVKRKVRYLPQAGPWRGIQQPHGRVLALRPFHCAVRAGRPRLRSDRLDEIAGGDEGERADGFPSRRVSASLRSSVPPIVTVVDGWPSETCSRVGPAPPYPEYLSLEAILGEAIHGRCQRNFRQGSARKRADSGGPGSARQGPLLLTLQRRPSAASAVLQPARIRPQFGFRWSARGN